MHRFFVEPEHWASGALRLAEGGAVHHARDVLRLRAGDAVEAFDGDGRRALCTVAACARGRVELLVREEQREPPPACRIVLFTALPKGLRFEDVLEKAVELGADTVVPLLTERVVARPDETGGGARAERWERIAVSAAEQCGAARLTRVTRPMRLAEALAEEGRLEWMGIASLAPGARPLRDALRGVPRAPACAGMLIGPEGDFTAEETAAAVAAGAVPVSLGGRVLRVETAAVFALGAMVCEWLPGTAADRQQTARGEQGDRQDAGRFDRPDDALTGFSTGSGCRR
jgi:16S rRNA (uracil1498-N3)-methyltransferase